MTENEFMTWTKALRTYYPRENLLPNREAMELWFRQLKDIPYNVASASLNKWVTQNKWSPSIADVREMSRTIQGEEIADYGQAWNDVLKVISNYGQYRQAEALESLPTLTRQTVERIGYKNLCMSENQISDRANFRMIYEQLAEREKKEQVMPEMLKNQIGQIKQKMIGGSE